MEPKQLSELPVVFQVIAGFGLFFGTFMLAIGGWVWKSIKSKLPESVANTIEPPKDVVLQSATIADANAVKALAGSIERLVDFMREQAEDDEHQMKRNREVLCEIRDSVDAMGRHIKNRTIM